MRAKTPAAKASNKKLSEKILTVANKGTRCTKKQW